MVSSVENIANSLFKIIKGYGHALVLFTDDGKKTIDPMEARRFFAKDLQMMVNLVVDESNSEVVVNLSKDTDIKSLKPMLDSLRTAANQYVLEFTVKTFGKTITPKDFSYQAKTVKESELKESTTITIDWDYPGRRVKVIDQSTDHITVQDVETGEEMEIYSFEDDFNDIRRQIAAQADSDDWHDKQRSRSAINNVNRYFGKRPDMKESKEGNLRIDALVAAYPLSGTADESHKHVIEKLEQDGYVEIFSYNPLDNSINYALTEKGKQFVRKMYGEIRANTSRGIREAKKDSPAMAAYKQGKEAKARGYERESCPIKKHSTEKYWKAGFDGMAFKDVKANQVEEEKTNTNKKPYIEKRGDLWAVVEPAGAGDNKDFITKFKKKTDAQQRLKSLNEGFSGWHGSAMKSINELGDARLVVRHKRTVDEEKRGARTRQIESIFIENSEGERFKFPSKNITAAKAMVRHVKEGGTPFDEFGQYIYETMEELNQLKNFQRKNRRNDFFEDVNISEEISQRVTSLRNTLTQISGVKGYAHHFENFSRNGGENSKEQPDELKDNVTVKYFDEAISNSLPYVARVIENMRGRQAREAEIMDFAQYVMDNKDNITLNRPFDESDPESPGNRKFKDAATAFAAWVNYLAPKIKDDVLSNKMMQASDSVFQVGGQHLKIAAAALKVIRQNATMSESMDQQDDEYDNVYMEELDYIKESMKKFGDTRKLFGA